jgi:mRNA-degrading endonuclease HigB of HigAB toxin-antitoxin module
MKNKLLIEQLNRITSLMGYSNMEPLNEGVSANKRNWGYPNDVKRKMKDNRFVYGWNHNYFSVIDSNNPTGYTYQEFMYSIGYAEVEQEGDSVAYQSLNKAKAVVSAEPLNDVETTVTQWNVAVDLSRADFTENDMKNVINKFPNLKICDSCKDNRYGYRLDGVFPTDQLFNISNFLKSYSSEKKTDWAGLNKPDSNAS